RSTAARRRRRAIPKRACAHQAPQRAAALETTDTLGRRSAGPRNTTHASSWRKPSFQGGVSMVSTPRRLRELRRLGGAAFRRVRRYLATSYGRSGLSHAAYGVVA